MKKKREHTPLCTVWINSFDSASSKRKHDEAKSSAGDTVQKSFNIKNKSTHNQEHPSKGKSDQFSCTHNSSIWTGAQTALEIHFKRK